jgi:hypothetical protein
MNVKDHIRQFKNKYATNHNNSNTDVVETKKPIKQFRLSDLPNGDNGTIRIRGTSNNVVNAPNDVDFSITKNLLSKYIAEYGKQY